MTPAAAERLLEDRAVREGVRYIPCGSCRAPMQAVAGGLRCPWRHRRGVGDCGRPFTRSEGHL